MLITADLYTKIMKNYIRTETIKIRILMGNRDKANRFNNGVLDFTLTGPTSGIIAKQAALITGGGVRRLNSHG